MLSGPATMRAAFYREYVEWVLMVVSVGKWGNGLLTFVDSWT